MKAEMDPSYHLHRSVIEGNLGRVKKALRNGANVNGIIGPYNRLAPLHHAVKNSNLKITQCLIKNGADPSVRTSTKHDTPLHFAAANYGIIKLLLKNGADCNARNRVGATPFLRAATYSNNPKNLGLLLAHGADITAVHHLRCNALLLAAGNGLEMFKFILDQGSIDIESRNYRGQTVLFEAILLKQVEVCELLLKRGAMVNTTDSRGETPLTP